jgi:EAL domain-containing protein (putative c-di-GMP-specific phosphodiesterase class I)
VAACAARIARALEGATIARATDDELVVVHPGCPAEVELVAADLVDRLVAPVVVEGRQIGIRPSVGVATSYGDHTPDDLVRDVGLAVARARAGGGRAWVRFDPSVHDAAREQAELATDLRSAIATGGLELHYQPIVALATGRVSGVEALCRWRHPEHGWVSPARFIPLAESSGHIEALGSWALRESCTQLRRWQGADAGITVSVNVAVAQLRDPGFVEEVRVALAATGVDPRGLVLEITESNLVSEAVLSNARALRDLGVGIAIDDFGTGYSSLSYLGRLPVTSLKIDKSFVDRLGDDRPSRDLVATIVELAHSFDLRTVAEGIESEDQAAVLRALGCQLGQGFRWSRAVPAAELDALLQAPITLPA